MAEAGSDVEVDYSRLAGHARVAHRVGHGHVLVQTEDIGDGGVVVHAVDERKLRRARVSEEVADAEVLEEAEEHVANEHRLGGRPTLAVAR